MSSPLADGRRRNLFTDSKEQVFDKRRNRKNENGNRPVPHIIAPVM